MEFLVWSLMLVAAGAIGSHLGENRGYRKGKSDARKFYVDGYLAICPKCQFSTRELPPDNTCPNCGKTVIW